MRCKLMKMANIIVFLMLAGLFSQAYAQTDVTSIYLKNTDFESNVTYSQADGSTAETPLWASGLGSRVFLPQEWTADLGGNLGQGGNPQYARMATALYGLTFSKIPDVMNSVQPPAVDKNGNGGSGLTLSGAFGNTVSLFQDVTLVPGLYELQYDVIDLNGGKEFTVNYFGFEPESGDATYGDELVFPAEWTTKSVSFQVFAETSGRIRIGIKGTGSGSGSQAKLFIDNVKLYFSDIDLFGEVVPLKDELTLLKNSENMPAGYDLTAVDALLATEATAENVTALLSDLTASIASLEEVIQASVSLKSSLDAVEDLSNTLTIDALKNKLNDVVTATNTMLNTNATLVSMGAAKSFLSSLQGFALNIEAAQQLYNETEEGEGVGQYPADDRTIFSNAINDAVIAFSLTDEDSAISDDAQLLAAAVNVYKGAIVSLPKVAISDIFSGQRYNLKHVETGMYLRFLDHGDGDFSLAEMPKGSNDDFDFIISTVNAETNTFMFEIRSGANVGYMSGSGWNTQLGNPSANNQKQIILINQGDDIIQLRAGWQTSNIMNFDCVGVGCRLYANKGSSSRANFVLELSPNAIDIAGLIAEAKETLSSSLTVAQDLLASTVGGGKPGQYTGREAFELSVSQAEVVYQDENVTLQEVENANTALLAAITEYRLTKINPYVGYKFNLKQLASGLFVSKSVDNSYTNARIQEESDGATHLQEFEFVSEPTIPDGVRLMASDGTFLHHSGYTSSWTDTPGAGSNIVVEEVSTGVLKLKFVGNGRYFGADGTTGNSSIYTDKDGSSDKHQWVMVILDSRISLRNQIESAETMLNRAVVGDEIGNHPQDAVDMLTAAIAVAESVFVKEDATEEEMDAANVALTQAISDFVGLEIGVSTPYLDKPFWIVHSSGMLLSKVDYSENAKIHDLNKEETLQVFEFEAVPGLVDVVALKSSDNKYLYFNSWNTLWSDEVSRASHIKISNTDDGYMVFKFTGKSHLGVNESLDSATVYSDKNATSILNKWMIQEPGSAIKIKLRASIVESDTLLSHVRIGTANFEFPQADIDVFTAVLNNARSVLEDAAATQENIDATVEALKSAQGLLYKAQVIPVFTAESSARYYLTNKQYAGYVTNNDARALLDQNVPLNAWEFIPVRDSVFVMKQGDLAVAHSLNMVAYDNTKADQQWYVNYVGPKAYNIYTAVEDFYFSLTKDNVSNVIQVASNGSLQIATTYNSGDEKQWFSIYEQGAPITKALEAIILEAETKLGAAVTGTAYGQYPAEAKGDLTDAIAAAQDVLDASEGKSQLEINNAYDALKEALILFANQKIVWRPVEGMAYLIGNRDNANYLSINPENPAQAKAIALDETAFEDQLWYFVSVKNKAGFYHIVRGDRAVGTSGGTSVFVEDYDPASASELEVVYLNTTSGVEYFSLTSKNTYPNIYINSDGKIGTDRFTYNNYQIKLIEAGALRTELLESQLFLDKATAGNGIGQYPQSAYDAFVAEIATAYAVAKGSGDQEDALAVLVAARTAFAESQNGYGLELDALLDAVERANDLIDNTKVIGDEPGKMAQIAVDGLAAAITAAQDATGGLDQTKVDTNVATLTAAITDYENELKESTGLVSLLTESQTQYDAAVEGTSPGEYEEGAKDLFKTAIDAAQAALDATPVVQAQLLSAVEALNAARDAFNLVRSPDLDVRDLEDAIDAVEEFLLDKQPGEFTPLRDALADAKILLASPDKTQDAVDDMTELLFALLEGNNVHYIYNDALHVYSNSGNLYIKDIREQVEVRVYSLNGATLAQRVVNESSYSLPVQSGAYVVHVLGANTNKRTVVMNR